MRMRIPVTAAVVLSLAVLPVGCTPVAGPIAFPAPSPSDSQAPTVLAVGASTGSTPTPVDVRRVDWASATIRMPELRDDEDCPVGSVTLAKGRWAESGSQGPGSISGSYTDGPPTYGDLDGDGRAEAVVYVSCWAAGGDSGDSSGQLLVVSGRSGALAGMGYVGPLAQVYGALRISAGRLAVTVTQKYTDVRQKRTYQWDGRRFAQVAGPTAFPSPPA
jgi:hypothetical protein